MMVGPKPRDIVILIVDLDLSESHEGMHAMDLAPDFIRQMLSPANVIIDIDLKKIVIPMRHPPQQSIQ